MDDLTLGDKIRAMKTGSLSSYGQGIDEGLDRAAALADEHEAETLQSRVDPWMQACFGPEISADKLERGDRLLEEVFELLQSGDYPRDRVAALEEYVWSRDRGEPHQEVGGVMITLAAYCLAHGLDMHKAGEDELARIWTKVEKIRAKQAAKPKGSALPIAVSGRPDTDALVAAAYEDAALMTGPDPDNEIATAIRARIPTDAKAALARIKREAEARGMEMACAALSDVSRPDPRQNDWRFNRSGFSNPMDAAGCAILVAAAKHRAAAGEAGE